MSDNFQHPVVPDRDTNDSTSNDSQKVGQTLPASANHAEAEPPSSSASHADSPMSQEVEGEMTAEINPHNSTASLQSDISHSVAPEGETIDNGHSESTQLGKPFTANTPEPQSDTNAVDQPRVIHPTILSPARPSKRKRLKLAILGIGVLVILFGGVTFAFAGLYMPNQPDQIIKQALANATNINSSRFAFEASENDDATKGSVYKTSGSGSWDQHGAFGANASLETPTGTFTIDARIPDSGDVYVKVNGLKQLGNLLSSFGGLFPGVQGSSNPFGGFDNQWIVLDGASAQKTIQNTYGFTINLSNTDKQKLASLYDQHTFIKVQKVLATESISGRNSYHYQVSVDKEQLQAFLSSARNEDKSLSITQAEIDGITKSDYSKTPVDLWIAKDSKQIDQLKFSTKNGSKIDAYLLTLSHFNETVKIDKPASAIPFLQVLTKLLTGTLPSGIDVQSLLNSSLTQ